ncbi:hypothetical protein ACFW1P_16545 [Paenibacillus sp. NPDC058910]|uniref:hypothetical protein n=1 Tax=unclassified Paenibacillus TaxID=185978 RepID=UPI0036CE5BDE
MTRIYIAGGYGVVGSAVARHIRSINQDVEMILAGRNPEKGASLAHSWEMHAQPFSILT